jgi:FMN phosphatase YigB (HAD superfamily)
MHFGLKMGLAVVVLAALIIGFKSPAVSNGPLPVIFFDLGNVLIDTKDPRGFHYVSGAQDYLKAVSSMGYTMGLISNVPESWGPTQDEKLVRLKAYVAATWLEPTPFPWQSFSFIFLPPTDLLRKPNPYLFNLALQSAGPCAPFYEGEDAGEIAVAKQVGFQAFLVSQQIGTQPVQYAPLNQLGCHGARK